MSVVDARLKTLGVSLPTPPAPVASYVPYRISGNMVFISGQVPIADGALKYVGKLGVDIPMDAGQAAGHLIFFQTAAFDRRRVVGTDSFHPALERFLCRVHDLHVVTKVRERHGYAAAHGTGTDHRCVIQVARLRVGRHVRQFRCLPFGEERIAQRLCLIGTDEFLEQFAFALHPLIERQGRGGFDGGTNTGAGIGTFPISPSDG